MRSKVRHISRINWKKFNIHNDINNVATMLVKDIRDGIMMQEDINGGSFEPLKDATKKRKGHSRALWDTGLMQGVWQSKKATKNDTSSEISVPTSKNRPTIAMYHNEGVKKRNLPKRQWFGVGKRGLTKVRKYISMSMIEKLRRGK